MKAGRHLRFLRSFVGTGEQVCILFDETRLSKRKAGSYTEGAGYEYAIGETAWYGASTFAALLRKRGCAIEAFTKRPYP